MKSLCERLLVPIDGSETSVIVAHHAVEIARQYGSQLTLLYVVDGAVRDLMARLARRPATEVQAEMEETGRRTLHHLAGVAEKQGVAAEPVLRIGMVHAAVVAEAEARRATLVIVGWPIEHELRGLYESRLVRQIISDSCCPVLVLKPESDQHHPLQM
jgi:nucleotide-binding universal stress UspA family protein